MPESSLPEGHAGRPPGRYERLSSMSCRHGFFRFMITWCLAFWGTVLPVLAEGFANFRIFMIRLRVSTGFALRCGASLVRSCCIAVQLQRLLPLAFRSILLAVGVCSAFCWCTLALVKEGYSTGCSDVCGCAASSARTSSRVVAWIALKAGRARLPGKRLRRRLGFRSEAQLCALRFGRGLGRRRPAGSRSPLAVGLVPFPCTEDGGSGAHVAVNSFRSGPCCCFGAQCILPELVEDDVGSEVFESGGGSGAGGALAQDDLGGGYGAGGALAGAGGGDGAHGAVALGAGDALAGACGGNAAHGAVTLGAGDALAGAGGGDASGTVALGTGCALAGAGGGDAARGAVALGAGGVLAGAGGNDAATQACGAVALGAGCALAGAGGGNAALGGDPLRGGAGGSSTTRRKRTERLLQGLHELLEDWGNEEGQDTGADDEAEVLFQQLEQLLWARPADPFRALQRLLQQWTGKHAVSSSEAWASPSAPRWRHKRAAQADADYAPSSSWQGVVLLVLMLPGGARILRRPGGMLCLLRLRGDRRLRLLMMVAGRQSADASLRAASRATLSPHVLCSSAKARRQLRALGRALARVVAPSRPAVLGLMARCVLPIGALVRPIGTRVLLSFTPSTRCGRTLPWTTLSSRGLLASSSAFAPLCSRARAPRTSPSLSSRATLSSRRDGRSFQKLSGQRPGFLALGNISFVLPLSGWPSALRRRQPSRPQGFSLRPQFCSAPPCFVCTPIGCVVRRVQRLGPRSPRTLTRTSGLGLLPPLAASRTRGSGSSLVGLAVLKLRSRASFVCRRPGLLLRCRLLDPGMGARLGSSPTSAGPGA